jgi:hypothetical protein
MISSVFRRDWVTSEEAVIKASSVLEGLGLVVAPLSSSALEDWKVVLESALLASKEVIRKEDLRLHVCFEEGQSDVCSFD